MFSSSIFPFSGRPPLPPPHPIHPSTPPVRPYACFFARPTTPGFQVVVDFLPDSKSKQNWNSDSFTQTSKEELACELFVYPYKRVKVSAKGSLLLNCRQFVGRVHDNFIHFNTLIAKSHVRFNWSGFWVKLLAAPTPIVQ